MARTMPKRDLKVKDTKLGNMEVDGPIQQQPNKDLEGQLVQLLLQHDNFIIFIWYIIRTCKFEYYKGPKNIWFDGWVMLDSSTFSGPAKKGSFAELRRSRVDEGVSATFAQAQLFQSKAGIRKHSFLGVLQRTLTLFSQPSTPQAT